MDSNNNSRKARPKRTGVMATERRGIIQSLKTWDTFLASAQAERMHFRLIQISR